MTLAERSRILIADDEESLRFLLREVMTREGYEVTTVSDGNAAVAAVRQQEFDLVVMDVRMPGMDGMQALKEMRRIRPHLVVLIMTAHGTQELAVEAMRDGAYDYFTKPFELDEMRIVVRRALEKHMLINHITDLEQKLQQRTRFDRIIGNSDAMRAVYAVLEKVVTNDVTVLVTGESGTGKELVAQAVHYQSARRDKPFIGVNCAAIPESLLESELFGHEKGAFTGAYNTRIGRFESANGGSIFLDEIGDMPLSLQSKMLRVLQEREVVRVGGTKSIPIDVRVIAATNQDLRTHVEEKHFREDLYFRLNVLPIHLPALRKRLSDLPLLAEHFIAVHNPRLNKNIRGFDPAALKLMMSYQWPGNVRELENVVQRAMVMSSGMIIKPEDLPPALNNTDLRQEPGAAALQRDGATATDEYSETFFTNFEIPMQQKIESLTEEYERKLIVHALEQADHHRQATADLLGISRKSLHNKMVKYQLLTDRTEDREMEAELQ